ncbi:hypothetical protein IJ090_02955 [Candidatus Saccharibacteria bacterium]|nr:hypothetical protein [Candidatus Saccharibacteria bacterium]
MGKLKIKKLAFGVLFASLLLPVGSAFADDDPAPIENNFDGKAYFVWACDGTKACYHLFENLKTPEEGINYIKDTEITDQSGNGVDYVFKQKNADWVLPDDFASVESDSYEDYIGDEDKQTHGVTIQAIAFGGGVNSIATNEDWNFQVIIYRDGYKAVTVGDNADDYTYFPMTWDFNYNYYIDVSGTSASSPAVVTTYLKEPTIKLKVDGIISVAPLNVNSGAVTVSPSLAGYDLTFNSSYYDHVVFELKSSDGNTYYLQVARTPLTIRDNFGPDVSADNSRVLAHVMFPTGTADEKTYSMVATVVKQDGTKTTSVLKSEKIEDIYGFLGEANLNEMTMPCGKGLTCVQFSVKVGNPRALDGVYMSVIKNGSTASAYSGTFSGSNRGTYYDAETRRVIYE